MIFLIDYDRRRGEIVSMRTFNHDQSQAADETRLQLELDLKRDQIDREVVVLEAASEADLRRTHRRYFEDMASLAATPTLDVKRP